MSEQKFPDGAVPDTEWFRFQIDRVDKYTSAKMQDDTFQVVQFTGHETISQPFHFTIVVSRPAAHDRKKPPLNKQPEWFIERKARLVIPGEGSKGRIFVGLIARFELVAVLHGHVLYAIELVPALHRAEWRRNIRGFSDLNTSEIVEKILSENLSMEDFLGKLVWDPEVKKHPKRAWCCQYHESDLDFISRLLEDEGIWYTVQTDTDEPKSAFGKPEMRFGDRNGHFGELKEPLELASPFGLDSTRKALGRLFTLSYGAALVSQAVQLREYDFQNEDPLNTPNSTELKPRAVYDANDGGIPDESYVPNARDRKERLAEHLKRRAQVRLQECQVPGSVLRGTGDNCKVGAGLRFRVTAVPAHSGVDFDREFLFIRVDHRGGQARSVLRNDYAACQHSFLDTPYHNGFMAMPTSYTDAGGSKKVRTFRPPRVTPIPTVSGVQTAVVVGSSNEQSGKPYSNAEQREIYGRVKVQFHWDRERGLEEKTACWVRVSQAWAGDGCGVFFLPRVREEVLVAFIEGDVDRPVIVGRVHNADQEIPIPLPDSEGSYTEYSTLKTRSISGNEEWNEIRFRDSGGNMELMLHTDGDLVSHATKDIASCADDTHVQLAKTHIMSASESVGISGGKSLVIKADNIILQTKGAQLELSADSIKAEALNTATLGAGSSAVAVASGIIGLLGAIQAGGAASTAIKEVPDPGEDADEWREAITSDLDKPKEINKGGPQSTPLTTAQAGEEEGGDGGPLDDGNSSMVA